MLVKSDPKLQCRGQLTRYKTLDEEVDDIRARYRTGSGGKRLRKIQMATAAMAVHQMRDRKNVLSSVPGGHGKSIIASFAAVLCINSPECE